MARKNGKYTINKRLVSFLLCLLLLFSLSLPISAEDAPPKYILLYNEPVDDTYVITPPAESNKILSIVSLTQTTEKYVADVLLSTNSAGKRKFTITTKNKCLKSSLAENTGVINYSMRYSLYGTQTPVAVAWGGPNSDSFSITPTAKVGSYQKMFSLFITMDATSYNQALQGEYVDTLTFTMEAI
jgi:hypothetical protein